MQRLNINESDLKVICQTVVKGIKADYVDTAQLLINGDKKQIGKLTKEYDKRQTIIKSFLHSCNFSDLAETI